MSRILPHDLAGEDYGRTIAAAPVAPASGWTVERLARGGEGETLEFLSARPVHTFVMSSFVRDNGLESPLNRGDFYACRDTDGALAGVALVGHASLFETGSDDVVTAFARHARTLPATHLIFGESEKIDLFWNSYAADAELAPRTVDALLYERRLPVEVPEGSPEPRRAAVEDVERVAQVHAEMAYEQSGINPLEVDREGFLLRTAQRIEKGRCWVCVEDGRLNFKADVVSETPDVIYLEGVYVNPSERGRGYGFACLMSLCNDLLKRTRSVVLLVNTDNAGALSLYERAGFRLQSNYRMIYPADGALS